MENVMWFQNVKTNKLFIYKNYRSLDTLQTFHCFLASERTAQFICKTSTMVVLPIRTSFDSSCAVIAKILYYICTSTKYWPPSTKSNYHTITTRTALNNKWTFGEHEKNKCNTKFEIFISFFIIILFLDNLKMVFTSNF